MRPREMKNPLAMGQGLTASVGTFMKKRHGRGAANIRYKISWVYNFIDCVVDAAAGHHVEFVVQQLVASCLSQFTLDGLAHDLLHSSQRPFAGAAISCRMLYPPP